MNYGKLYIIPNENKILGDVFYRQIVNGHLPAIQEFSDYYHLGY